MKRTFGQLFILPVLLALFDCNSKKEEIPVIPPLTSPLSGDYIGYGVITASFTHVMAEPAESSYSLGYLRRGSLVKIIKRQSVKTGDNFVSWVLTEGTREGNSDSDIHPSSGKRIDEQAEVQKGWLKEEIMVIYDSENQARTASQQLIIIN